VEGLGMNWVTLYAMVVARNWFRAPEEQTKQAEVLCLTPIRAIVADSLFCERSISTTTKTLCAHASHKYKSNAMSE
jgi:hypothetical protein